MALKYGSRYRVIAQVIIALTVVASPSAALAQGATVTASIRGTVLDTTGSVLRGATVTLTNTSTHVSQTVLTDARGGYAFSGVFPGVYVLSAELSGFKIYEQQGVVISPQDARGIDVRLEVGEQTDRVTVIAQRDVIQTETGAREGVLTAAQIDNLSVISRSSLELLRILPGVVAPKPSALESVSFGGGANDTQAYTVNGIRSSNNTVQLDGSSLIDIGCNCGGIVTLNNDMVQEVKVQSANYAAEYGSAPVAISAVTKGGSSTFHGTLYEYNRDYHLASNDRSNIIFGVPKPKSTFNYPGGNIGGPILVPGWRYTRGRDRLFFFFGLEAQRQKIDQGARVGVVPTVLQREGLFTEFLTANGQSLNQPIGPVLIPPGYPGAGTPAPGADLRPYIHPLGRTLVNLYPLPTGSYQNNRFNYVLNVLQPNNRLDIKTRVDWNPTNNTRMYVRLAHENEDVEDVIGLWGLSDVALPSPMIQRNRGRSVAANIVSVLNPTMTNETLVSWSRLRLDNGYRDSSQMRLDRYEVDWVGPFPGESPWIPGVVPNSGGEVSNLVSPLSDMYAHNDALQFSDKLTKLAGAHALKFGVAVERLQKQQTFPNDAEGNFVFAPSWTPGTTGNTVGDILTGRITQVNQGTNVPDGRFRMWNLDAFAQDSWKLRSNLTLEYGIRAGYWTNNAELGGLGGWFDPARYAPGQPQFLDPGVFRQLNGVCYVATGCAPAGILGNRPPFAMPRVNGAWNIDGRGQNVLRGGYGLFFNRSMGDVEYIHTLSIPPAIYHVWQDAYGGSAYGNGIGLTYDTTREATLASRVGSLDIPTLTPQSFTFPTTHSFSVSYARRLFFNQVVEAGYVGTRGKHLVSRVNGNPIPEGSLLQGTVGNADLSHPVNRVALDTAALNQFRPYQAYAGITITDFRGVSDYNSLQVTLSRQTSTRLQYFVAYTLSRTKGTFGGDYSNRDPFDAKRTYGISSADRTHTLTVSWNALVPDGARGPLRAPVLRGILNGWQLSGISTVVSGDPIWLSLGGDASGTGIFQAYYGTPDIWGPNGPALSPVYTCDPRLNGKRLGEKVLDIDCIAIPAFGQDGQALPPYNMRRPWWQNHDVTVFKNFALSSEQRIQVRVGFFNIFNTAYADGIDLNLEAVCNKYVDQVPNGVGGHVDSVCDPAAGFHFSDNTKANFGNIFSLSGHRVIEFALKYYF